MLTMSLLASGLHRIGFFGQEGVIWAFIGFIALCVVVAILFKIMNLLLPALGIKEPWASVIYWVAVLICFVVFLNFALGWS